MLNDIAMKLFNYIFQQYRPFFYLTKNKQNNVFIKLIRKFPILKKL